MSQEVQYAGNISYPSVAGFFTLGGHAKTSENLLCDFPIATVLDKTAARGRLSGRLGGWWKSDFTSVVSHFREIVVSRQARNLGKLHNTVHCIDCTVQSGSGSVAQVARTIWSQRTRLIVIRLGENNADCSLSQAPSHQRNTG